MDWTKIKTKHYLYSDFSLIERGALSTLLCLVAHLEKIPTEKEMLRHIPKGTLRGVRSKLEGSSKTLGEVFEKVLEDVTKVTQRRVQNSKRVKKHRVSKDCNALQDKACNGIEKIKEHKKEIIEEKEKGVLTKIKTPLEKCLDNFYIFRKKIKANLTDHAKELLNNELNKLAGNNDIHKIKILEQSIMNGWKGVFPLKEQKGDKNDTRNLLSGFQEFIKDNS